MRDDRGGEAGPTAGGRLAILLWLSAAVFAASAPLVLGVIAADAIPGLGGVDPAVPKPFVAVALMAVVVVAVVFGGALDRALECLIGRRGRVRQAAKEGAATAVLALVLLPLMADLASAVVASVVATVLYRLAEPWLDRLERSRPGDGAGGG
ncbi:hypothetical protein [Curtobacterium sp. ISL-83]|uniref:hypothetical protein n=1 Tax=Curtobacterium sp. ISL-83 TaxID=2819145 RepID=UPI001BEBCFA5|nr:hypothetical protein [Curtobacterium sp. ISL-83]MBT2503763.1 hypothetical protein [Curtobacterium sp. ISL-83]